MSEREDRGHGGGSSGYLWLVLAAGVGLAVASGLWVGERRSLTGVSEEERAAPLPPPPPVAPEAPSSVPTNAVPLLTQNVVQQPPTVGETTYNGIVISSAWPPTERFSALSVMDAPYLRQPPEVIDISIGRQLFPDDFLVESMTNLTRTHAQAEPFAGNPVLRPEHALEREGVMPQARPAGDGVWWDPTNYHFKAWYRAGGKGATALAISTNGTNWAKPALHGPGSSSIVQPDAAASASVILDTHTTNTAERCRLFRAGVRDGQPGLALHHSSGGTNWGKEVRWFGPAPEGSSVAYNPFRERWIFALAPEGNEDPWRYWEMKDLLRDPVWTDLKSAPVWTDLDAFDRAAGGGAASRLRSLEITAYESLLVGVFGVFRGDDPAGRGEVIDLQLGYSRDGFHWIRPERRPFIPADPSEGAWNATELRGVGGGFNIVGRRLNFFYGATGNDDAGGGMTGSMGLSSLRRDGFAAITAGKEEGVLVTKPVRFTYAGYMLVNLRTNAPDGELRVGIVSPNGNQLEITDNEKGTKAAFSRDNCVPVRADQTLTSVNWNNIPHVGMLMNRPVRFVFYLKNASLYSFWVSRSRRGRSEGFSAGGGLHYLGPTDNIGNRSYREPDYVPSWRRPQPKTNETSTPMLTNSVLIRPSPPNEDKDED